MTSQLPLDLTFAQSCEQREDAGTEFDESEQTDLQAQMDPDLHQSKVP